MNVSVEEGLVPDDCTKAVLVALYKSKSNNNCDNYRGISIRSIGGKVYGSTAVDYVEMVSCPLVGEEQRNLGKCKPDFCTGEDSEESYRRYVSI